MDDVLSTHIPIGVLVRSANAGPPFWGALSNVAIRPDGDDLMIKLIPQLT